MEIFYPRLATLPAKVKSISVTNNGITDNNILISNNTYKKLHLSEVRKANYARND